MKQFLHSSFSDVFTFSILIFKFYQICKDLKSLDNYVAVFNLCAKFVGILE